MKRIPIATLLLQLSFFQPAYAQISDTIKPKPGYVFARNELVPEVSFYLGWSSRTMAAYNMENHVYAGLRIGLEYRGVYAAYNRRTYGGTTFPEKENSASFGYRVQFKRLKFGGGVGFGNVKFDCKSDVEFGDCQYYNIQKYPCFVIESDLQIMLSKHFSLALNFSENINERKNSVGFGFGFKYFPFKIKLY